MTWLAAAGLLFLAIFGAPLFVVIMGVAMLGFWQAGVSLEAIAIELYRLTETPLLLALPMFAFSGYLLAESGTSKRLVAVCQALFGSFRTNLVLVSLLTCAFFTAFTGASGVTIVAIGALLYPALSKAGYSDRFGLGLVTSSGSLGLLLAPSLPLILYGIIAQQMETQAEFSLQTLFIAGIMPSALMLVLLVIWGSWHTREMPIERTPFTFKRLRTALGAARYEIPLPFLVLGGVYSGIFVLSEAAAVTACYVLIVEVLLYKEVRLSQLPKIMRDTGLTVGGILLILGVALALTNVLVDIEAPQTILQFIQTHVSSKWTFLILLNLLLLVLGAVLDIFSALIIMTPLLLPIAESYGIHPVHFGIIFLANMQIGYFTPPIGMNLFIASYRFKKPVTTLYAACLPFMWVLLVALLLITYIPWISLAFVP